jgi:hypothetical protein
MLFRAANLRRWNRHVAVHLRGTYISYVSSHSSVPAALTFRRVQPPRCSDIVAFFDRNFQQPICKQWTLGVSSNRKISYKMECNSAFPRGTTISEDSASGGFVIVKHWRLTISTSASLEIVGDTYAWENTRARAIGHSRPDYIEHFAQQTCIPSFKNLLPEERENVEMQEFEYHDPVTQRVKLGCSDDTCSSCMFDVPMAEHSCKDSVTCQV